MKKSSIFTTTTLAGALLFSGVGVHQAHAAESEVTADNATEIGSSVMKENGYHPENVNFNTPQDKGDYYLILYGNKSGHGSGAVKVHKDGLVESGAGAAAGTERGELTKVGYYQFAKSQDSTSNNSTNDNANSEQQKQTTDNNISTQNTDQQTTEKNVSTQNNKQQTTKALPETGEQSNSGLVTIIASVLLAAGSLLTFKRFSNNK